MQASEPLRLVLRDASRLPGDVTLQIKLEAPGIAQANACPEQGDADSEVSLGKATTVLAEYGPAHASTPQDRQVNWGLTAFVYHTGAQARAARAKLLTVEKHCPRRATVFGVPLVRTTSIAYTVDGWAAYRTVDELSVLNLVDGPDPVGVRLNDEYLLRGNVLLNIKESGTIGTGTTHRQDVWRQATTTSMLAAFDAAATA